MRVVRCRIVGVVCLAAAAAPIAALAEEEAAPELVQLVIDLLADRDKDVRALGLEQVRTSAQGAAATRRFAEQLPKLPPDGQAALLSALADRADPEARAAVLELLAASSDEPVRLAAIEALGFLGQATDARLLIELLSDGASAERAAARASLVRLPGDAVSSHIAAELAHAPAPLRVTSIEILAQRRAFHTVPDILPWATDADAAVRAAAMSALGELAGPEHVAGMVQGVLKAEPGPERTAAEKSIVYVCGRIEDRERRADPLIDAMNALESADRRALLPTLGRVGGQAALRIVEDAIDDPAPELHDLGLRALCHWPDASISQRLMGLVGSDEHSEHRTLALRALVRVAPLPDERSDEERLALLKQAFDLCTRDEERLYAIERARAIRTVETLRFLLPFLDQPELAQQACLSVVELAHHRGLREPNKAEFDPALDKVIATSTDAVVIDRAQRYKRNQTWVRPAAPKRP